MQTCLQIFVVLDGGSSRSPVLRFGAERSMSPAKVTQYSNDFFRRFSKGLVLIKNQIDLVFDPVEI